MNFTPELIAAAKTADSPESLIAIAKDHGITLSDSEAALYFRQLRENAPAGGELSDDELDSVSGGGCGGGDSPYYYDVFYKDQRTFVKHNNSSCPICYYNEGWPNNEFYLYFRNYEKDSFYLYCSRCGNRWEAAAFKGDPRTQGIYPC